MSRRRAAPRFFARKEKGGTVIKRSIRSRRRRPAQASRKPAGAPTADAQLDPGALLRIPGYLPTLIAVACAFGAWSLLLPVIPLAVLDAGGSATLAGGTTGVFMATTVATQWLTPRLLRRWGYNPVMVAAAVLLGLPALGHLLGMTALPALLFSAIRGVGFGALCVAQAALVAELVPLRYLGKASGLLGVFVGSSQMVFLPVGLWLAGTSVGFGGVYVCAAVVAVLAGVMCLRIPRLKPTPPSGEAFSAHDAHRPRVATWKIVTVPWAAVCTIAMGYGAVSSFLPAAVRETDPATGAVIGGFMLSLVGGAIMVMRYISGLIADRRGAAGSVVLPGQIMTVLGLGLMVLVTACGWSVWLLVVAALLFGGGFGMVQNDSLLMLFARLPRERVSDASAYWNMSYDSGTGVGSVILGAVVAQTGYPGAFAAAVAFVAVGMAATVGDAYLARHRITEYSNTRARLRQVPVARSAVRGARKLGKVAAHPVEVGQLLVRRPPRPGWKKRR